MISNYVDFFNEEISRLYKELHSKIRNQYRDLYNQELKQYKCSSEYKRIKNKEYWNRPKEVIEKEQLEQEKAKLGYWVPHTAPSDTCITYQEKAYKDSTNSSDYETPSSFEPSISVDDYFDKQKNELSTLIESPIILFVLNCLAYKKIDWERNVELEKMCSQYLDQNVQIVFDFLKDLDKLNNRIEYKRKNNLIDTKFFAYFGERSHIVLNDCIIKAKILEQENLTEFKIDVLNHPNQIHIIGKKEGDIFTLPNINLTYKIEEIWK